MYYFCKGESRSLKVKKQKTLKTIFSNKLKKFSRKKTYALWSPFLSSLNVIIFIIILLPTPNPLPTIASFPKNRQIKIKMFPELLEFIF